MKVNCDEEGIAKANETIRNGGVIIFPTDTLYGIGCDPYNIIAVKKFMRLNQEKKENNCQF